MKLIILFVLLLLSAFFSSAETAFTTVRKLRMQTLAQEEENRRAALVLKILENPGKMLSTILIGNNIVNISASALATVFATNLAESVFGERFLSYVIGLATGILTVLVLIFGEIIPKTVALINNERLALFYAPPIRALEILLTPVIFAIDKLSNGILRLLRISPDRKVIRITESELLGLVDAGHEDGVIESGEREMIHNMFEFSDAVARDIMIPRVNITMVDSHAGYEEIMTIFKEHMYTRIPVYEETPDKIIGMLNVKDFLFFEDTDRFHMQKFLRDVYYTYEYKKIPELLSEMREKNLPVTIVISEYGTAEAMITMEDLLEEIIGEIRDEYDADEAEMIMKVGDGEYRIEGTMKLDDINDAIGTSFESEDYDSISGIVIEHLDDRLPREGETVELDDGTMITVEALENNRIKTVRMKLPQV